LTLANARALITQHRPDLVLLDLHMPGESGHTLVYDLNTDGLAEMQLSKDKTQLKVNQLLTLTGIPAECFEYRLGKRSALD
jgi:CheY-like chemotaxis protein